jgi:hypothetical protein
VLQNDHYYADSMQRFLGMLTKRMYGSSSAQRDSTYQSYINSALANLAAAGITMSKEELELLPAMKKQVSSQQNMSAAVAAAAPHTACGLCVDAALQPKLWFLQHFSVMSGLSVRGYV